MHLELVPELAGQQRKALEVSLQRRGFPLALTQQELVIDKIDDAVREGLQCGMLFQVVLYPDVFAALPAGPLIFLQMLHQLAEWPTRPGLFTRGRRSSKLPIIHGAPRPILTAALPVPQRGPVSCAALRGYRRVRSRSRPTRALVRAAPTDAVLPGTACAAPRAGAPARPRAGSGSSQGQRLPIP